MLAAWDILKPLLSQTIAARNLHGTVLPQQLKTATMQDLSCCPMCNMRHVTWYGVVDETHARWRWPHRKLNKLIEAVIHMHVRLTSGS